MKTLDTDKLTDWQYNFLSDVCESLGIAHQYFPDDENLTTEISVTDLKVDDDGVIYAPTVTHEYVDISQFGKFETFVELKGYKPLLEIYQDSLLKV